MSRDCSIGYLTGSAKVIKNHFSDDDVNWRTPRTLTQMFFQPYESKEEFIYCARHTLVPLAQLGLALMNPIILITVPAVMVGISTLCNVVSSISNLCGNKVAEKKFLSVAEGFMRDLCQMIIDLVVLPLSLLVMVTRGVSTAVHAAGIGKEPKEQVPSSTLSV